MWNLCKDTIRYITGRNTSLLSLIPDIYIILNIMHGCVSAHDRKMQMKMDLAAAFNASVKPAYKYWWWTQNPTHVDASNL